MILYIITRSNHDKNINIIYFYEGLIQGRSLEWGLIVSM